MAGREGMLEAQNVARAAPTPHCVRDLEPTHAANQNLFKKLTYDPVADFEPVASSAPSRWRSRSTRRFRRAT